MTTQRRVAVLLLLGCAVAAPLQAQGGELPRHIRILAPDAEEPAPVVVWASGCSGFFHPRAQWHFVERAQHILSAGFAVVFVDYLGAANLESACAGEMSLATIGESLVSAVASLEGVPEIDLDRLVYLGGSLVGGGVLAALSADGIDTHLPVAVLSLYPSCVDLSAWTVDVPVWIWFADEDRISPPSRCGPVLGEIPGGVTQSTYPEAHHAFDMRGLPTALEPGQAAIAYHASSADDVWARIEEILRLVR